MEGDHEEELAALWAAVEGMRLARDSGGRGEDDSKGYFLVIEDTYIVG